MLNEIKPNEIMFLDFINGKDENLYIPEYWKFDYGIDIDKTINKFIRLNYLTYKSNLTRNVFKSTIPELKQVLKDNDLKVTGKKDELAKRVLGNIDIDYLNKIFKVKSFSLTPLGQKVIEDNYLYIINQKRNYHFSDKEIEDAYNNLKAPYTDNDRIWVILNHRVLIFANQKKWHSYRNNLFYMGELLFNEDNYAQALSFYISVFMLDLSGMTENNVLQDIYFLFTDTNVITSIKSLISLCDYCFEDVKVLINTDKFCIALPFRYYTSNILLQILSDCLNGIPFDNKRYPHNKPNKNSKNYIYGGFEQQDDEFFPDRNSHTIDIKNSTNENANIFKTVFKSIQHTIDKIKNG